jgi:organic hydroperoxide reductase OsmC/OhrA
MWQFNTSLKWLGGEKLEARAGSANPALEVTPPPDLGGQPGFWTPEDLLVSAVETCMLLTTISVVGKQKISMTRYESKAVGRMEKTPEGLRFTGMDISVQASVSNESDLERVKKAVSTAEKYCPVSNAVKCPVRVTVEATVG